MTLTNSRGSISIYFVHFSFLYFIAIDSRKCKIMIVSKELFWKVWEGCCSVPGISQSTVPKGFLRGSRVCSPHLSLALFIITAIVLVTGDINRVLRNRFLSDR